MIPHDFDQVAIYRYRCEDTQYTEYEAGNPAQAPSWMGEYAEKVYCGPAHMAAGVLFDHASPATREEYSQHFLDKFPTKGNVKNSADYLSRMEKFDRTHKDRESLFYLKVNNRIVRVRCAMLQSVSRKVDQIIKNRFFDDQTARSALLNVAMNYILPYVLGYQIEPSKLAETKSKYEFFDVLSTAVRDHDWLDTTHGYIGEQKNLEQMKKIVATVWDTILTRRQRMAWRKSAHLFPDSRNDLIGIMVLDWAEKECIKVVKENYAKFQKAEQEAAERQEKMMAMIGRCKNPFAATIEKIKTGLDIVTFALAGFISTENEFPLRH
jgi:hypothetical protein